MNNVNKTETTKSENAVSILSSDKAHSINEVAVANAPQDAPQTPQRKRKSRLGRPFEEGYAAALAYVRRTGHAQVPISHEEDGCKLGAWVSYQRAKFRRGALSQEAIDKLQALDGWQWCAWDLDWSQSLAALRAFIEREGHADVPTEHLEGDFPLGEWTARQRYRYRSSRLTGRRLAELKKIPGVIPSWDTAQFDRSWNERFEAIIHFVNKHGHTNVPRNHIENGLSLGIWVNSMRSHFNRGMLAEDRIKLLESIPQWHWARPRGLNIQQGSQCLVRFALHHGHTNVPRGFVDDQGFHLGSWVFKSRAAYKRRLLDDNQIAAVEAVQGWSWENPKPAAQK